MSTEISVCENFLIFIVDLTVYKKVSERTEEEGRGGGGDEAMLQTFRRAVLINILRGQ
jgi:hypothetical protein